MHFRYTNIQTATTIGAPSPEELAMFECFAKNQVEEGQNLLESVVCKNPSRLYYLFAGLLKDQPRAAFGVASNHLELLNAPLPQPTEPSKSADKKLKAKPEHPSPTLGLEQISKEYLLLLQAIPVLKPTNYSPISKKDK